MSKESCDAAATTSAEGSMANDENDNRVGAVKVLKLRYLSISHARIEPSRDAVKSILPRLEYLEAVTAEVCSVNVAMWKPDEISQILMRPSSAPVIILAESGEYDSVVMVSR